MQRDKFGFEATTCSRCGGSGKFSYCAAYGTTCFKCGGKGITYTVKGHSALMFFRESLEIPASQVKVGMLHRADITCKWFKVLEVSDKISSNGDMSYSTNGCTYHRKLDSMVTALSKLEDFNDHLLEAMRFQSRLTKKGTEKKKYINMRGEL